MTKKSVKVGELIRLLEDDGWRLARTRGSHRQYQTREQVGDGQGGRQAQPGRPTWDHECHTQAGWPEEGEIVMAVMRYMVVERGESSWGAHAPDLPGCAEVGETREEVLRLIREAIEFHIDGLKQDGLPVPPPSSESEFVEVGAA